MAVTRPDAPKCLHCRVRSGYWRGLCYRCFRDRSVRDLYPKAMPNAWTACRHCRKGKVNRPRGLCWTCYYTPGVKDRYPSASAYANRGGENFHKTAPLPEPTAAPPGTPEKVAALESRAAAGQNLWHPLDATS